MLSITDPREHPTMTKQSLSVYDGVDMITSSISMARDVVARLQTVGGDGVIEEIPTNLIYQLYRVRRTR